MGGGGQLTEPGEPGGGRDGGVYTWEEVQSHSSRNDQWLVIDRKVYNITQWAKRHPGGFRVISHYAGEDATVNMSLTEAITTGFCGCGVHKCQWWNVTKFIYLSAVFPVNARFL